MCIVSPNSYVVLELLTPLVELIHVLNATCNLMKMKKVEGHEWLHSLFTLVGRLTGRLLGKEEKKNLFSFVFIFFCFFLIISYFFLIFFYLLFFPFFFFFF